MSRGLILHLLAGAAIVEALGIGAYLWIAAQFTTGVNSALGAWWPIAFPALFGAIIGLVVWFVRTRR